MTQRNIHNHERVRPKSRQEFAKNRSVLSKRSTPFESAQIKDMKQLLLEMPNVGLDEDFERSRDLGKRIS